MDQDWRPIKGFEDAYEVSYSGQIRRLGKPLQQYVTNNKYLRVFLYKNGFRSTYFVHRLVAYAFLPEPSTERQFINHKDGNKLNNSASNLEWVTRSENLLHDYQLLGRIPYVAKLNKSQAMAIRASPEKTKTLALEHGVSQRTVQEIKARNTWKYL